MSPGWTEVALGEVAVLTSGGTPDKERPEYYGGDVPWITSADIVDGLVRSPRTHLSRLGLRRSAASLAGAGTVLLVTRTGVGKVAVAQSPVSYSQDITAVVPDTNRLDTRYLHAFLKWRQQWLVDRSRGATIKGVSREVVNSLRVPLPPLAEQRQIVRALDSAEALQAMRREGMELLSAMIASVYVAMFGDPVTNSRKWPITNLGALGELERGVSKHRPRNAPELLGGPFPLIQTGDVARSGGVITKYSSSYSEQGLRQSRLWPAGTLCITIAANIAKTGILAFDACFPDSIVGFSASPATTTYVQAWLSFLQPILERSAPESAQKNINLAILRALPVPTPQTSALTLFANQVAAIRVAERLYATSLTNLECLTGSLQSRAFTGGL